MRKFAINYSKKTSQNAKRSQVNKKKLKEFVSNLNPEANFMSMKLIYERNAEVVKIRSKWQWYEEGEKSKSVLPCKGNDDDEDDE